MTRIAPPPLSAAFSAALMIGATSIGARAAFAPSADAARQEPRANVAPCERVVAIPLVRGEGDGADASRSCDDIARDDDAMLSGDFDAMPAR